MSQIMIVGDPHIGKGAALGRVGLGTHLNSRVVDQLNLLDWILEQAIEKMVDNIIITGDVFEEPRPHPSLVTLFIAWLKKCQSHHIYIHILMGNHDLIRSGSIAISPLDIIAEVDLEYINVYKDISTIFINNSAFTLIPFKD